VRVYLVRHAIAEPRDAGWADAERPLSERGRERFQAVALALGMLVPPPQLQLTSPLLRARETAAMLHELAAWPAPTVSSALVDCEPGGVQAALAARQVQSAALVAHEPGLSELASWLLAATSEPLRFDWRRGGVACLDFDQWGPASAELRWFVPPRFLRVAASATGSEDGV
jgi:phosphohistidine phosphatase